MAGRAQPPLVYTIYDIECLTQYCRAQDADRWLHAEIRAAFDDFKKNFPNPSDYESLAQNVLSVFRSGDRSNSVLLMKRDYARWIDIQTDNDHGMGVAFELTPTARAELRNLSA